MKSDLGGIRLTDRSLRRFLLVGLLNTAAGVLTMFGFYRLLGLGYWGASALSYFLCSIMSYLLNKHYTFGSKAGYLESAAKFAANIAVCYGVAYLVARPLVGLVLGLWGGWFSAGFVDQAAMLAGMVIFTGLNYVGQRFLVFGTGTD